MLPRSGGEVDGVISKQRVEKHEEEGGRPEGEENILKHIFFVCHRKILFLSRLH